MTFFYEIRIVMYVHSFDALIRKSSLKSSELVNVTVIAFINESNYLSVCIVNFWCKTTNSSKWNKDTIDLNLVIEQFFYSLERIWKLLIIPFLLFSWNKYTEIILVKEQSSWTCKNAAQNRSISKPFRKISQ